MANDADTPPSSASITGYYYLMRDQPDFWVGIASLDRGALRLEARYNYEASDSTSLFAGWRFAGRHGELAWEVTPLLGGLFGQVRGVVPALEASLAYGVVDLYVEAEYVRDLDRSADSYFYLWSEIGWSPLEGLRVGLAGQRTRTIDSGRDVQLGVFAQVTTGPATWSFYAFNPDGSRRYVILSLGATF